MARILCILSHHLPASQALLISIDKTEERTTDDSGFSMHLNASQTSAWTLASGSSS